MQPAKWLLRVGVCGTFIGHGLVALSVKTAWLPFLMFWGFSEPTSVILMKLIGCIDLIVAFTVLVKPIRIILIWATVWAFATALMRPLTGLSLLAFFERSSNWAAPLALLWLCGFPRSWKELWQ